LTEEHELSKDMSRVSLQSEQNKPSKIRVNKAKLKEVKVKGGKQLN